MKTKHFEIVAISKYTSNIHSKNVQVSTREEFNREFDIFSEEVPFSCWRYEIIPEDYMTEEEKEIVADHEDACYLMWS